MDKFPSQLSNTLVQLLYTQLKWSHQFTSLSIHITSITYNDLGSWFLACLFITGSEYNVSGLVIIIDFVTGSMLSLWDSRVDMATEGDVDPC